MAKADLKKLYAASHVLDKKTEIELGLQIPFDVYLQDPMVAEKNPELAFDQNFYIKWEPGLTDGPTSSRFAVVDYNGDTGRVAAPAKWDEKRKYFNKGRRILNRKYLNNFQFDQVNVWAIAKRALNFYEEGFGLGRPIPWAFNGNRLVIVPHAGYGKNAFYDRTSKSLQFYYYGSEDQRVYTCLSTDIINHEIGHAILDGIRPLYLESVSVQTAAFHESIGDLTAILLLLRNNEFRRKLAEGTSGDMSKAKQLAFIAEQFGRTVKDKPYLRSAMNKLKMKHVIDDLRPHYVSQVLTGTMFEILIELSKHYTQNRNRTPKQAFWDSIQRMQRMAIQPLDLLPPVDVNFKDYALAVLRAEELSNPKDPHGYYKLMLRVFRKRGILDESDEEELLEKRYLHQRLKLCVFPKIYQISRSRAAAYRFLDDNREELYIPSNHDIIVSDLYDATIMGRQARRLPRQVVLEYMWRELVKLNGQEYGRFNGKTTSLLCGGTLVFDEYGHVISWFRKPGTQVKVGKDWQKEVEEGTKRRDDLLVEIARQVNMGRIGVVHESERGILGTRLPPIIAQEVGGSVRLQLSPFISLVESEDGVETGGRKWEISF